jgi:hypothetical protein
MLNLKNELGTIIGIQLAHTLVGVVFSPRKGDEKK